MKVKLPFITKGQATIRTQIVELKLLVKMTNFHLVREILTRYAETETVWVFFEEQFEEAALARPRRPCHHQRFEWFHSGTGTGH